MLLPADIESAVRDLPMKVGRVTDSEVWALCPAHKERTGHEDSKASNFSVNRDSGVFSCFACGYQGNFVKLVQDVLEVDGWDARTWIIDHGGSVVDVVSRITEKIARSAEKWQSPEPKTKTPQEIDLEYATLPRPPVDALWDRDLDLASVEAYDVRWAEHFHAYALPMHRDGFVHGWQLKAGHWVRNVPFGVRKREFLFGWPLVTDAAIVVESPLDAVRIHAAGYDAVATFGAKVSEAQMRMLSSLDVVILCMDADPAGAQANQMLFQRLRGTVKLLHADPAAFDAKDPGDMTDSQIRRMVEKARPAVLTVGGGHG